MGVGAVDCGEPADDGAGGAAAGPIAVRAGGVDRSSASPGAPIRYPAMPEPSISATTKAAKVDLFMETPPRQLRRLYDRNCVETVEVGKGAVNNPPLWRAGHACNTTRPWFCI